MNWDVFISHASEDKKSFVLPFVEILSSYGVHVWYDNFTLKIGDSLSRSIDEGLKNCNYGIVVLSKEFFRKGWPDYELRSLLSREVGYKKVILPIWHNISKDEVMNYSPYLADKFALSTSIMDISNIALQIIEVVRPDIYQNYNRLILYNNLQKNSIKVDLINPKINSDRPFRHDKLSVALLLQIKVIQELFFDVYPISYEEIVNRFKRDKNPDREVLVWHRIAATYLYFLRNRCTDIDIKKDIFAALLFISASSDKFEENRYSNFEHITVEDARKLFELYNSIVPDVSTFDNNIYAEFIKEN